MSGSIEPPFESIDRSGMGRLIEGAAEQVRSALDGTPAWAPVGAEPDLLAVGAMGGSAIAADLTAALYRDRLPRPMLVVRDYRFPACVGPASLVLLASYSGNTEEALSLADEAIARRIPWRGLTTGGRLGERCSAARVESRPLPAGMPPRAATYAAWVAMSRLLASLGWIDDPAPAWREAAEALASGATAWGPGRAESDNAAKRLARAVKGKLVFLHAEQRLEPVVTRWRNQLNENAKLLAHSSVVPELNHNEVVGWERPGSFAAHAAAVVLRDGNESAPNAARLGLTAEYLRRQGVTVIEPEAPRGGGLARMASLVLLGDYVSFYLAMASGVDPTPIVSLDEFKRSLSAWHASRADPSA